MVLRLYLPKLPVVGWPALVTLPLMAASCASWPADRMEACPGTTDRPAIISTARQTDSTLIRVLTYNVEGLPWPARRKRGPWLDRIGAELARMRAEGTAPDIVLMQEAFVPRAAGIARRAGYANAVRGPTAADLTKERIASDKFVAARRRIKGERSGKPLGSGLYVLSDFPILQIHRQAFSRHACAGFDCLAAKGVMLVRLAIPGLPTPLDVLTTHMNAGRASRVAIERTVEAHQLQAVESARFLDRHRDLANPLILGGDFNMRRSPERFDFFTTINPYQVVHRHCQASPASCDVRMSWDGDAPWLDTQDLQAFDSGQTISVAPVRVEAIFDGPETGGKLSDHDGFLVTYRLSWPRSAPAMANGCS